MPPDLSRQAGQPLFMTFEEFHEWVDEDTLAELIDGAVVMTSPASLRHQDIINPRLKRTYLDGPADLVVEVVSPESAERNRSIKFDKYQEAGISEYWLIDPLIQEARFYQLDTEGRYQPAALDDGGAYHSRVLPGFWLRVSWLWQDPPPDTTQALLEIDRDAYAAYLLEQLRQAGI